MRTLASFLMRRSAVATIVLVLFTIPCAANQEVLSGKSFPEAEAATGAKFLASSGARDKKLRLMKFGTPMIGTPAVIRYRFLENRSEARPSASCEAGMQTLVQGLKKSKRISVERFKSEVVRGMELWSAVAGVAFVPAESLASADLMIAFTPYETPSKDELVLGRTEFTMSSMHSTNVHATHKSAICFDSNAEWAYEPHENDESVEVMPVAAHEAGHVLGLDENPSVEDAMMSNAGVVFAKYKLAKPDVAGAQYLYGGR